MTAHTAVIPDYGTDDAAPEPMTDREMLEAILATLQRMEAIVSDVVTQAGPVIDSVRTQGLMGLMRQMM